MSAPCIFLHGAIGASYQLRPLREEFPGSFALNFPGHGGQDFAPDRFCIPDFAGYVLGEMDARGIVKADFFGYSMGGYVALYIARHYPERAGKIFTLGTKLSWDEATAAKEVKMLDPVKIREKVPKFAAALEKRHAPLDWETVLWQTAEMMLALGKNPDLKDEDFRMIQSPVLLSVGDSDTMVSIEETMHVHRCIPGSRFAVLPATPHPIEQVDRETVVFLARKFFN